MTECRHAHTHSEWQSATRLCALFECKARHAHTLSLSKTRMNTLLMTECRHAHTLWMKEIVCACLALSECKARHTHTHALSEQDTHTHTLNDRVQHDSVLSRVPECVFQSVCVRVLLWVHTTICCRGWCNAVWLPSQVQRERERESVCERACVCVVFFLKRQVSVLRASFHFHTVIHQRMLKELSDAVCMHMSRSYVLHDSSIYVTWRIHHIAQLFCVYTDRQITCTTETQITCTATALHTAHTCPLLKRPPPPSFLSRNC